MPNFKIFNLAIFLLVLQVGCKTEQPIHEYDCETLTYVGNSDIKDISEIISERIVLQPETNDNSIIGNTLRRVIQHDSLLIFLDNMKQILVFTIDGRHKFTIHNVGQGPGEYINLADVAIDEKNKELILLTYNRLLRYSLNDGQYCGKSVDLDGYYDEIIVIDDTAYLLCSTLINNELATNNVATIDLSKGEKSEYLNTIEEFAPYCSYSGAYLNTIGKKKVILTRKFDTYIYLLAQDSYCAQFNTSWGSQFLHPEKGTVYDCGEISAMTMKTDEIFVLSGLQVGNSIMTFTTNLPRLFYSNLITKEIFSTTMLRDSELPIFMINLLPVTNSDGWVLACFEYPMLKKAIQVDDNCDTLKNILANMDSESNPLFILYKLK